MQKSSIYTNVGTDLQSVSPVDLGQLEDQFIGTGALLGIASTVGGAVTGIINNKKNRQLAEKQAEADRLAMLQLEAERIAQKEKMQKLYLFAGISIVVIIAAVILISKYKKS